MTREEAIAFFKDMNECTYGNLEAVDMAIKALKQLPKLQNRCFALTQGQLCMFCPYDCENRTTAKRMESEDKE